MSSYKLWGEIEPIEYEDKKEFDNTVLEETLTKLTIGGPMKLHQPYSTEDGSLIEVPPECSRMDDNVLKTVNLFERVREHYAGGTSKSSVMSSQLQETKTTTDHDVPMDTDDEAHQEIINRLKFKQDLMGFSSFPQPHPAPPELRSYIARQILQKCMAAIIAQQGYDTSTVSALETLTDVAQHFLKQLSQLLKVAVELEDGANSHGFPNAVERAFHQAGLGSVTNLHYFYQDQVLGHCKFLESVVKDLPATNVKLESDSAVTEEEEEPITVSIKEEVQAEEDDIPELHFGNGEASEEIQSTLEPGFQMLHNLEEAGGLG